MYNINGLYSYTKDVFNEILNIVGYDKLYNIKSIKNYITYAKKSNSFLTDIQSKAFENIDYENMTITPNIDMFYNVCLSDKYKNVFKEEFKKFNILDKVSIDDDKLFEVYVSTIDENNTKNFKYALEDLFVLCNDYNINFKTNDINIPIFKSLLFKAFKK